MTPLSPLAIELRGIQLIEASAGTGKTHTITTLFVRLLLERKVRVDQILVVTFTKAATAELRDRVRRRLGQALAAFRGEDVDPELAELARASRDREGDVARLEESLSEFDQAAIFTIHGFCQRAIADHAFEGGLGFDLSLVTDQRALVSEAVLDFWVRELSTASPAELEHLAARRVSPRRWQRLAAEVLGAPDLRIIPEPRVHDPGPALQRFFRLKLAARDAFLRDRAQLLARLSDPVLMNQHRFPSRDMPARFAALDAFFDAGQAHLGGFETTLGRLTSGAVSSGTKKGKVAPPRHALFELADEMAAAYAAARTELDAWQIALEHRLVAWVRIELPKKKREKSVQTFDDLLLELDRALDGPRGRELARVLSERHPVALVDEFQDTDPVQYRIFRRLYRGQAGALFLIGDPKQAIYGFRGADVFSYLGALGDAGDHAHTLGVNHRSDPGLVWATNRLFARADHPFVLHGIEYSPVSARPGAVDSLVKGKRPVPPFQVAFVHWEPDSGKDGVITKNWPRLPERIAADVARMLGRGLRIGEAALEPGNIAVLTRKNDQAFEIQRELGRLGIPSVLLGDKSVLDSSDAVEMSHLMRALSHATSERNVATALTTGPFGLGLAELRELYDDPARFEPWVEAFRRWQEIWTRHGFLHAFRALLRESGGVRRLLSLWDGERRLTNLLHLAELLHTTAIEEELGPAGLLRWFEEVRQDEGRRGEMAPEALQLRLESDAKAVQLTTMHKSKGLEYDVVFCPYLWDGAERFDSQGLVRFHAPDARDAPVLSLTTLEDGSREAERADLEYRAENMRLAYVALTRAKRATRVVWGRFRTAETSPLAALLHASEPDRTLRTPTQRVKSYSEDELERDLSRWLVAARPFALVEDVATTASRFTPPERPRPLLSARPITRRVELGARTASFTALVRGAELPSQELLAGRDTDAELRGDASSDVAEPSSSLPLAGFPRGAVSGQALHLVLERWDPTWSRAESEPAVREALVRYGIDSSFVPAVAESLSRVVRTPLDCANPAFRLADVPTGERLVEVEFTFPVGGPASQALTRESLARVFEGFPELPDTYAARVRELGFAPLQGFLRGFVDLVVRVGGRFFLLDYKSNHLGERPEAYAPERLQRVMAEHHYYLQYHLYTVALCRYLQLRLPGFDYERDFGGVYYLFLRGMSPDHGSRFGVFFERPPRTRIDALGAALGGGAR